jgi:hypothetical protein
MDAAWLPSAVAAGLLGVVWYDMRRQTSLARREWKRALYREDGTPIYIMRAECGQEQTKCQQHLCGKIADLRAKLDSMDARREAQRDVILTQLGSLAVEVGGIKSSFDHYVKNRKGEK